MSAFESEPAPDQWVFERIMLNATVAAACTYFVTLFALSFAPETVYQINPGSDVLGPLMVPSAVALAAVVAFAMRSARQHERRSTRPLYWAAIPMLGLCLAAAAVIAEYHYYFSLVGDIAARQG